MSEFSYVLMHEVMFGNYRNDFYLWTMDHHESVALVDDGVNYNIPQLHDIYHKWRDDNPNLRGYYSLKSLYESSYTYRDVVGICADLLNKYDKDEVLCHDHIVNNKILFTHAIDLVHDDINHLNHNDIVNYINDRRGDVYRSLKHSITPSKSVIHKNKKSIKKSLIKASRTLDSIMGHNTTMRFLNNDRLVIEGKKYEFVITKSDQSLLDINNMHIGYTLSIVEKGNRLYDLCIVFPNTPIFDQILSIYMMVVSGQEEEIIKNANKFNISEEYEEVSNEGSLKMPDNLIVEDYVDRTEEAKELLDSSFFDISDEQMAYLLGLSDRSIDADIEQNTPQLPLAS